MKGVFKFVFGFTILASSYVSSANDMLSSVTEPQEQVTGQFLKAIYGTNLGELEKVCIFYVKGGDGKVTGLFNSDIDYCSESDSDPNQDLAGKTIRFEQVQKITDRDFLMYLQYEVNTGIDGVVDSEINYVGFTSGYYIQ